jgi:hypothetical protein
MVTISAVVTVAISGLCFVGPSVMIMTGRHARVHREVESSRPVGVHDRLLYFVICC